MGTGRFIDSRRHFNRSKLELENVVRAISNNTDILLGAASTNITGDDPDTHDHQGIPTAAIAIIAIVASLFLIFGLSVVLVFFLRRRKPMRMEMTEGDGLIQSSESSLLSKLTVNSTTSTKFTPLQPLPMLPPFYADHSMATVGSSATYNIPRVPVKREAIPASPMPSLISSDPMTLSSLPTMSMPVPMPFVEVKRNVPNRRVSIAKSGQVLKIINVTPTDFDRTRTPSPSSPEMSPRRRMNHSDLPKIHTNFIKKNGRIAVAPLNRKPSSESMRSRVNTSQTETSLTITSGQRPNGPRPLPVPPALIPGNTGNE